MKALLFFGLLNFVAADFQMDLEVEEVYCQSCIKGMREASLPGVKQVDDFSKEHSARLILQEDVNIKALLEAIQAKYTYKGSRLVLSQEQMQKATAGGLSLGENHFRFSSAASLGTSLVTWKLNLMQGQLVLEP